MAKDFRRAAGGRSQVSECCGHIAGALWLWFCTSECFGIFFFLSLGTISSCSGQYSPCPLRQWVIASVLCFPWCWDLPNTHFIFCQRCDYPRCACSLGRPLLCFFIYLHKNALFSWGGLSQGGAGGLTPFGLSGSWCQTLSHPMGWALALAVTQHPCKGITISLELFTWVQSCASGPDVLGSEVLSLCRDKPFPSAMWESVKLPCL